MRLFLCTIAPMLTAAVLAVVGGERLSRREDVQRTPHDRNRLLDFSTALQVEIQRLESLYHSRLHETALAAVKEQEEQIKSTASETVGISLVQIFRVPKKDQTIRVLSRDKDEPEILMEGRKRAFSPKRASYLSGDLFSTKIPLKGVWLKTHNEKYRVYYESPDPDQVIAFLVDFQAVTSAFRDELENWIKGPSLPILEAEERVSVSYQSATLLSSGSGKSGPSAAIIPYRTIFGDLEVQAWDGIETSSYRDPLTLISTVALALLLFARQIIGNLLSNVEKYATTGKECQVSLLEKDEQLVVEVSDNGPGIPKKEKDRIFQPFERVHLTTSEGSSGTGLGLSIARDLASRMQGTLELLDSDTGCTFCLTLPVKPAFEVITLSRYYDA